MAFHVVIDLVPPPQSDYLIGRVLITGELDKPPLSSLPVNNTKLQEKLHVCHITAWKILAMGITQQITGVQLRAAAKAVFKLNDFQAENVSAVQIKQFMEESIAGTLKLLQKNVSNYYAGPGKVNMSGGGRMGSAIRKLDELYEKYQSSQSGPQKTQPQEYQTAALEKQIEFFRAAYDESPFQLREEKALARGEYVAFWYQIYHGGEPNSTRYAKFLIETWQGQLAIDNLIENGS